LGGIDSVEELARVDSVEGVVDSVAGSIGI
jgi:hypothetical protein